MNRITIENMPAVENEEQKRHLVRYVNFINSRPERKLKQCGFHTHHIYPESIAKKNCIENYNRIDNLIKLTPREHFIAHLILWKCGYKEMIYAFYRMTFGNKIYDSLSISSKQYERLQLDASNILKNRIWIKDENNNTFAIQKEELDEYLKKGFLLGRGGKSTKNKIRITNGKDNLVIDESDLNLYTDFGFYKGQSGKSTKNKVRINKDGLNITIPTNELDEYTNCGWHLGIDYDKTTKKRRMTDGLTVKKIPLDEIEEYLEKGWRLGTTNKPTKNKVRITKDGKNKFVDNVLLDEFLAKGWVNGFAHGGATVANKKCMNRGGIIKYVERESIEAYKLDGWKLGSLQKGTIYVNKDKKQLRVAKEDIDSYLENGWTVGPLNLTKEL